MGVVKVYPVKYGMEDDVGAGVVVGGSGEEVYIVTAYHVVKSADSISIEPFGDRGNRYTATIFDDRYDPSSDIVVLSASRYPFRDHVEQLYEARVTNALIGSEALIVGHPNDQNWNLRRAQVSAVTSDRILLDAGVVEARYSGGPLTNRYGNIMGIVTGIAPDGHGEVVRYDLVRGIMDGWGVRYETKLKVDFCNMVNRIVPESLNDFDNWKGARKRDDLGIYWAVADQSTDITGTGRSMFLKSFRVGPSNIENSPTVYVADFGQQFDNQKGRQLQQRIANQIVSCLPGDERIARKDKCLWVSYRAKWWRTPISFVTNLTNGDEVELYMYRGYNLPRGICEIGRNYLLDSNWPSEW